MTVQITVRIPDDVAAFVDEQVRDGAKSRASVITRALQREQRRKLYEQDALALAARPLTAEEAAEEEAMGKWALENAARVWADLD